MKPLTAWSYSRYALWALCPMRFKHEVLEGNKVEASPAMARGNDIHKGVAAWLIGQAEGVPRDAIQNPRAEQLLLEMRQFKDIMVEQQWGFTASWKETSWFGKDTWLRVVLDVGLVYDDMTAEAIDFKTGKRYGTNDDQMELFALAMMCKVKPVKHVTTRLIYLDEKGNDIEELAEFPATHKQRLIDKWTAKVAPMFNDQVFAPRPNDKCKWCPLARSKGGKCAFG
jgi:PD-(D/E)XK nuclease superfamily